MASHAPFKKYSMFNNVPINQNQHQCNNNLANIVSLQSGGLQIFEGRGGSSNGSGVPVSVLNNQNQQPSEGPFDKGPMRNFITTLQSSGIQVIENNSDQTLSISLPNQSVTEISQNSAGSDVSQ